MLVRVPRHKWCPRSIPRWCLIPVALAAAALIVVGLLMPSARGGYLPASRVMANRVICLDAGHGGIDPGAVGASGAIEKRINLETARILAGYLRAAGATVVLTREGDEDLADLFKHPQARKVDDLDLRVEKAISSGADIFISIHCNKFPSSWEYGPQTFYVSKGHPDSRRLAETIQRELARATDVTWRQALGNSQQYVLKQMSVPAVTVELGFLSNPNEEALLTQPDYQRRLAWAVFTGIARFLVEGLST
ncbi:MAG: N-acetylmuramoyl-L-alanine amidase family protein [Bacillota bacterium]